MVKGSKAALRLPARGRKNENRSGACVRSGETHLADRLIAGAEVAVAAAFALAFLYLVIGLIRPSWAWATKRRSVVLRTFGLIVLAGVGFAGVIGYALTLPASPHSFDRYMKDFDWDELRKQDAAPTQGQ
jgi:hypothetical protein